MKQIEQGSPEWHAIRCGKVTASRVADVVARLKSGAYGASRATYMGELLAERLSGKPAESFKSGPMEWGTQTEPEARAAYIFRADVDIETIGFVEHPRIANAGASPDGLIGADGLIEIKCPNTKTHVDTLLSQSVSGDYLTQMHWQMACTGRKWCDFVSYDPRLPERMRMFVKRVPRDQKRIDELEMEVSSFIKELDDKIAELTARLAA